MPAVNVPKEAIPELAARVNSPTLLKAMRLLRERQFLHNGPELDAATAAALGRLVELGLADPAYAGPTEGAPFGWVSNGNGEKVLRHFEQNPRYEIDFSARAKTALLSLPPEDRVAILGTVAALQAFGLDGWPAGEAEPLDWGAAGYFLTVSPDLRAFARHVPSGTIELFDIVRADTLRLFLERQHAEGKVG